MRSEAYKSLIAGDAFTFLDRLPGDVKVGGRLSHWFATDEPGRLFEVTRLHHSDDYSLTSVETRYLGFAFKPGWFYTVEEVEAGGGEAAMREKENAA